MRTNRNSRLLRSIRIALSFGAVGVLSLSGAVQAAEEDDAAELDRVEVTGSRLSQLEIEGANPVTVISREDITRTGYDSVGQVLQSMPVVTGSPVNTFTNNGGSGATTADLRGLGVGRTLVLINGRRADWAGDLNTLPIAMVERIDILKEGASAVYGADAVAGVINIITRSDFEGMELSVQHSNWDQTNAPTNRLSAITGGSSDRGNFVVGFDFVDQDDAFQDEIDTPWMKAPLTVIDAEGFRQRGVVVGETVFELGSSSIPGGHFFPASGGAFTLDYTRNSDGTRTYDYDQSANGGAGAGTYRPYVGSGAENDTYNYNPANYIQTPNKRFSFFSQGRYDINSDLSAFFETQFQRRESEQFLAPLPYFSDFGDPGFFNPATGVNGVSADNFYNPFGEDVAVRRRVVETGGRRFFQAQDAYRAVLGVNGLIGSNWEYEVSYNYSGTMNDSTDYGQFYGENLANALGPSFQLPDGSIVCGDPGTDGTPGTADDNIIAGCVPMNMFGGPGTITQEMLDYAGVALNDRFESRTDVLTAILQGDLFELPAGWMQGAFGVERRREKLTFVPDSGKVKDAVTGNAGEGTNGSKEIDSYFAEFSVPLLSGVPGAELLNLSAGVRQDDFSTFGSATSEQIGLKWQPINDLMVRATVGTSFREPTIGNLFSGQQDTFPTASDPCGQSNWANLTSAQQQNCLNDGVQAGGWDDTSIIQLRGRIGGNPTVGPEEGESFTFGFGYAPSAVPGLNFVVDYWDFEVEGTIGALSVQALLDGCALEGIADYCARINRQSDGTVNTVIATTQNLGALKARGVDLEVNYAHSTGFGDFDHRMLITRLLERSQQEQPGAEFNELVGLFDNTFVGDSAFPELKFIYTADWSMGNFGASARVEYIDDLIDDNAHPFGIWARGDEPLPVDSVWYLDLTGRYFFATDTTIDVGITNVTDEEAPFINSGFNANIDESTYRPMGRGYFLRLTQRF